MRWTRAHPLFLYQPWAAQYGALLPWPPLTSFGLYTYLHDPSSPGGLPVSRELTSHLLYLVFSSQFCLAATQSPEIHFQGQNLELCGTERYF